MAKQLSIASNAGYLFSSKLLQRFLAFFTTIALTRYLGPESYGQYTYIISFVTLSAIFWNFGIDTVLTRDMSRDPATESFQLGVAILSKGAMFTVVFLVMSAYFIFAGKSDSWPSFMLFATGMFIFNVASVFNAMFSARRRLDFSSFIGLLRSVVLLLTILFVIHYSLSLKAVFIAYFSSFAAVLAISLFLAKKFFVVPDIVFVPQSMWVLVRKSLPFFLTSAVNIFLFRVDQLMLANISGDIALGYYGAAYTLFEVILSLFPMMIMSSAFPVLARLFHEQPEALEMMYSVFFKYFLIISLPMSIGMAFVGKRLCIELYGIEYVDAGSLLVILGAGIWIFFLSTLVSWFLTACDKQKIVLLSNAFALVLNIVLNIFLIPKYQGAGAAYSTIACELLNFLFMFILLSKTLLVPRLKNVCFKLFFALVLLTTGLFFTTYTLDINSHVYYLIVSVFLSVFLYGASMFFLRLVSFDEMKIFIKN